MQAIEFRGPRDLAVAQRAEPRIEDPRDVLVRVQLAGLCGSDLHPYRGDEAGLDAGTVMGHEFVGEVLEVGAEVERWKVGARVVGPFSTSCGACVFCVAGLTARCVHGELFGWVAGGQGLHGAQAECVRVPFADATLVSVEGGREAAAWVFVGDVLATGFHAAALGAVGPGQVVVVLGCGPVGLCAVQAARALGAEEVLAVDRVPDRLERAAGLGATPVELDGDPRAVLRRVGDGHGAHAVLEAVGSAGATRLAYELVRPGGVIAAAGVHTEPGLAISAGELYDKNLSYRAGRCSARAWAESLAPRVAAGEFVLEGLVSHVLPLAEGPEAYARFEAREAGWTKVLLQP